MAGGLPDDFPEELIPPDSEIEFAGNVGFGLTVQFTSSATIEEMVAYYEDALGAPTFVTNESATWSIIEADKLTTVTVTGTDGALEIGVAIVGS